MVIVSLICPTMENLQYESLQPTLEVPLGTVRATQMNMN